MGYLHIGMNVMVDPRRVIGIFDLDNTSTSKLTRRFWTARRRRAWCSPPARTSRDRFVVCDHPYHRQIIYLSQLNSQTLLKRAQGKGE